MRTSTAGREMFYDARDHWPDRTMLLCKATYLLPVNNFFRAQSDLFFHSSETVWVAGSKETGRLSYTLFGLTPTGYKRRSFGTVYDFMSYNTQIHVQYTDSQ